MSDLIRQSVSWSSVHGTRSYSRVTALGRSQAEEPAREGKTEETGPEEQTRETSASGSTRRGSLLDVSV